MNYANLKKLRSKPFFTVADVRDLAGITLASARVLCSRYKKKGVFIRIKNDFYLWDEKLDGLNTGNLLRLANYIQVPSYVSFMSALSYHEITTQPQRDLIESASLKRSISYDAKNIEFHYHKLKPCYYFGFTRIDNCFIATKEKALVDALYLTSLGRYRLDYASLDLGKLDQDKLRKIIKSFPWKTKKLLEILCKIS